MHFNNFLSNGTMAKCHFTRIRNILNVTIHSLTHIPFTRCGSAVGNKPNQNIQQTNRAKQQNKTARSRARQVTTRQNREGHDRLEKCRSLTGLVQDRQRKRKKKNNKQDMMPSYTLKKKSQQFLINQTYHYL